MTRLIRYLIGTLVLALCAGMAVAADTKPITLGVFALRPKPIIEAAWRPFADYLGSGLGGREVRLRILDQAEMQAALRANELDLVLTNPAHFIALRAENELSGAIATQVNLDYGRPVSTYGGVIVTRADNPAIRRLADLEGKVVATSSANFLATYAAQALELKAAGIDPETLHLKPLDQEQDSAVFAVIAREADAAFIRTGLLEQLIREGHPEVSSLRVINRQSPPDYPYVTSTRLYPEWPLVTLPHVDQSVVRKIGALALLLPAEHPAAQAAAIQGFTVAADYSDVETLLRELRLPPFEAAPVFTWDDVWTRYRLKLLAVALAAAALIVLLLRLLWAHMRMKTLATALEFEHQHLGNVVEATRAGSWEWDVGSGERRVDRRWAEMLGLGGEERLILNLDRWRTLVHPDDLARVETALVGHLNGETSYYEQDLRLRHQAGHWVWVHDRALVLRHNDAGRPELVVGAQIDISGRKRNEEKLRLAANVFSSSYEAIVVTDAENRIIDVNPAFVRITGYTREEALGKTPSLLRSGRHDTDFYRKMWAALTETDHWQGEIWNRRKSGEEYAEILSISRVKDDSGMLSHYVAVFVDISRLKRHEEELNRIAHFDPLTGAPNRRLLDERLRQAIARARRSDRPLAVCVLDLDEFKPINDRYGHEIGDRVLVTTVQRLSTMLRGTDTVARLGGDEFVLLLEDVANTKVLERILLAVSAPIQIGTETVSVSVSIGATLFPEDDADSDTLLRHADQAMYRAKQQGRNCIQMFDPDIEVELVNRRQRHARLDQALQAREFILHYQPQVDMATGGIVGTEALIRWLHPEEGLLPPASFLPYIEGTTLESALGEWVIGTALSQIQAWEHAGHPLSASVNIGANHLLQPDFPERLEQLLARHPEVPPNRLELEILESTAIDDMETALEALRTCRALGVRLALDDFGTGYASLKYFRQLPVDRLKIDRSFVLDMLDDAEDRAIVQSVIQLAEAFGREVIAEGVETPEHAAALRALGCRLGQGYGIARPMPAEHIVGWLSWYAGHDNRSESSAEPSVA